MKCEGLEEGALVFIQGKVHQISDNYLYISFLTRYNDNALVSFDRQIVHHLGDSKNGTKNTETAPKYDPCRLFRKGDKVRLVPFNGRAPIMYGSNVFGIEEVLTVEEDENKEYEVLVNGTSARQIFPACYLELVTPVEYFFTVEADADEQVYSVTKGPLFVASYGYGTDDFYTKDEAKRAAEAECARLNAEYRKGVKNSHE